MPKQSPWGTSATGETPREKDRKEAIELTIQAVEHLKMARHMNDFDSALWRLVDAAGLTGRYANVNAVGSETNPTNMGYFIDQYKGLAK